MGRLFWKVFLGLATVLIATGLVVGGAVRLYQQAQRNALPYEAPGVPLSTGPIAESMVRQVAGILRHGGPKMLADIMRESPPGRGLHRVLVVDDDGRELLERPLPSGAIDAARSALEAGRAGVARVALANGEDWLAFVASRPPPRHPGMAARFARWRDPTVVPPWVWTLVGVAVSLAFSAALAWYLARPIRVLRRAFDSLADGRLDTRVGPLIGRRSDELADLGRHFDAMAVRVGESIDARRRLLHDVSHELRSPLARMQAAIGLARQRPETSDTMLERIERESERLDALVGEVLTLARLESDAGALRRESVSLSELLRSVVADARFEAEAEGKDIELAIDADPDLEADPELLHRAFENVVRNAIRHSPPGRKAEVTLGSVPGGWVQVRVRDHGPGVAAQDLSRMFEPFRRGEDSPTPGFGLGLAIARRAIERHGGRIEAANCPDGGLAVTMRLAAGTSGAAGAER
ncbi:MAG: HAMP domain-containing protein [Burkholderiaceae bacterium]|nr:HAMP domain-containing protein [Burkholderiaceae bacterium]